MGDLDDEEVPLTEILQTPPPPPPPPAAPEVIEVVEDEADIEETIIETTETDEAEEIEVAEIEVEEVEEDVEVPFSIIENVPVFPGCERKKNNDERKKCMSSKIDKFIQKHFDEDLASDLGLEGKNVIRMLFKIDKTGKITGITARAPHPDLEREAKRVMKLLPRMQPGKQRGRAVTVPFTKTIVYQIQ